MLNPVLPKQRIYNIVPNSGLQFLDLGFDSNSVDRVRQSFCERGDAEAGTVTLQPLHNSEAGGYVDSNDQVVEEADVFTVRFQDALAAFTNCWLPVPYLKQRGSEIAGESFEKGPTNWVRMRITPLEEADENGFDHRLTLVIDTAVAARGELDSYVCPIVEDVENEAIFGFASNVGDNSWLLSQDWIEKWLSQHIDRSPKDVRVPKIEGKRRPTAGWALYVTLLNGIKAAGIEPRLKLVDTVSPGAADRAIDVDLVLDIGNSRTCGVLIEKREAARLNLKNAQTLRLRDFTNPILSYREPFQSDVEFRRTSFGDDRLSRLSGRPKAFSWPSIVRVGPEAVRLNGKRFGSEGASGLSAPKRYLWDEQQVERPWYYNTADLDIEVAPTAVYGELCNMLTRDGDALSEADDDAAAAIEPLFSRSSLFSMMLVEVIMQAFIQINSVAHRRLFEPEGAPRRLSRVIITIPTGTPLVERELFEKRARHARALLLEILGDSPAVRKPAGRGDPLELVVRLDEATCTQITYLYGLITDQFQRHGAGRIFRIVGRPDHPGLRIASLDIGGGTTDLMISDFTISEDSSRIRPEQLFREGFRKAGDDLLRAVISRVVLPGIATHIAQAGSELGNEIISEWMRGSGHDDPARQSRKLFTGQVLRRLGLAILAAHEEQGLTDDYVSRRKEPLVVNATEALDGIDPAVSGIFVDMVRSHGIDEFTFDDLEIRTSGAQLEAVIGAEMDAMLHDLSRVVYELDCDILLLSGRPSRLPAMHEIIRRHIPVSPHRIVPMHGHRVGDWNPFASGRGIIEDPKTTVVVGALIAALGNEGGLEEFDIDIEGLEDTTTARIIGRMEGGFVREQHILFDDIKDPEATESPALAWSNTAFIGFRQLASGRWPATPLYRLSLANNVDQRLLSTRPWSVVLERDELPDPDENERRKPRPERLRIHAIEQTSGDRNSLRSETLELRLQTMFDDDYWLDTGFIDYRGDEVSDG